ncbi:discoidin domain-containing protein [Sphingobium sp. LMC3-1-1.1]|uniref:GTA baseplate fiber-binding domain-containing protein n=1 Tax=Sphingobium sp. LMC3-1-1.1 TaxID=3135241 RepID=UPI0034385020
MADPVSFGLTLALTAVQMGLQASRKIEGPRLSDRTVSLGDPGDSKNYFLGTCRLDSCSFLFAEDIREVKRKRKSKSGKYTEYRNYGTWANHIADHPIEAVTRIWFDKHLIYDVTGVGPVTPITSLNLSDFLTIYVGGEDQEPDPRLAQTIDAKLGEGSCTAYRGESYVVFKDIFLEKWGNRLPQPSIEATRSPAPNYPWESFDYAFNKPLNLTLDSSGTYALWGGSTYELWDIVTRTRLSSGTFSEPVSGGRMGISSEGRIYAAKAGGLAHYEGGGIIQVFDGATGEFKGGLDTGGSYQDSCIVLTDGKGNDHLLTYAWSFWNLQYHMKISEGFGGWLLLSFGWKVTQYLVDSYGDIWAVGTNWGPFVVPTTMYLQRIVDTGVRSGAPSYAEFTVPATPSPVSVDAVHHDGNFVIQWAGTDLYLVDDETLTVTDHRAFGYQYAGNNWVNHNPMQSNIWLGTTEVSLRDLSTIRTVDPYDWKAEGSVTGSVSYIRTLNALLSSPVDADLFTLRYLDRVGAGDLTVESVVDLISSMCAVEPQDYDASLCTDVLKGFKFSAGAAKSILAPVLEAFDIDPGSEDFLVRFRPRGGASEGLIPTGKIVPSGDSRFRIPQAQPEDLPLQVTMAFADVNRDQQVNVAESARAADAVRTKRITQLDMRNMSIDADTARHLVDRFMRRQHAEKESYEFSLSDRFLKVTPGSVYTIELDDLTRIARCVTSRMGADRVTETRWVRDNPTLADRGTAPGAEMESREPERIQVAGPSRGFILDVPLPVDSLDSPTPFLLLAAAPFSADSLWGGAYVYASDTGAADEYDAGWAEIPSQSIAHWGVCTTALGDALPWLPDLGNSITIDMRTGTLTSVTMDDLLLDPTLNLVLIGQEYVQFATATLVAPRQYELSGFLRGRRGTEQHVDGHVAGDSLLVMDAAVLSRTMGASEIGDTDWYKVVSVGREEEIAWAQSLAFTAAAQKPYAPVHGSLTLDSGTGDWSIDAVRRTRIGGANLDGTDVPLGETAESWSCDILFNGGVVRTLTGSSLPLTYTAAQQVADTDRELVSLSVNLYQVSPALSLRGFPLAISANTVSYGEHLYWRLLALDNWGDGSVTGLSDIELRGVQGGPNLATGGTPSVSNAGGGGSAAGAFDGDPATGWVASGTTNQWAQYQFADPVEIVEVQLFSGNIGGIGRLPRDCKLQYSDDGSSWTDAFAFTWDAPLFGDARAFPQPAYASGYARAWRLNVTANNGDSVTYIEQLEFRATAGGADQAHPIPSDGNGDSTGRAVGTSGTPWGAFNPGDHWGNATSLPAYAGFVFPDPVKVEEIAITNLSTTGRSPRDFTLDYLDDDGVTWVTQKTWTGITWSAVPETKTLAAI